MCIHYAYTTLLLEVNNNGCLKNECHTDESEK